MTVDAAANRRISARRRFKSRQGRPLYGILCPDWIKWAGIPAHYYFFFSFTECVEGGEIWITDQTLYNSDYCWIVELFKTCFKKSMSLTAALTVFSVSVTVLSSWLDY